MESGFSSLYGYTSDQDGIRHGGIDFKNAPAEDAKYKANNSGTGKYVKINGAYVEISSLNKLIEIYNISSIEKPNTVIAINPFDNS